MNDILLFGAGYDGDLRDVEGIPANERWPAKPRLLPAGPGQEDRIEQQYLGFLDFEVIEYEFKSRFFLIGVHGIQPQKEIIDDAIFRKKPTAI